MPRPHVCWARRRSASLQHAHARTQSYLGDIRDSNAVEQLRFTAPPSTPSAIPPPLVTNLHPPDVMSGWHSAPRWEPSFTLPPKHDRSRDMIVPGMHHACSPEPVSDPRLHASDYMPRSAEWYGTHVTNNRQSGSRQRVVIVAIIAQPPEGWSEQS